MRYQFESIKQDSFTFGASPIIFLASHCRGGPMCPPAGQKNNRVGLSAIMWLCCSYSAKCCLSALRASHHITKRRKSLHERHIPLPSLSRSLLLPQQRLIQTDGIKLTTMFALRQLKQILIYFFKFFRTLIIGIHNSSQLFTHFVYLCFVNF